jgi:WD40 repeat protein
LRRLTPSANSLDADSSDEGRTLPPAAIEDFTLAAGTPPTVSERAEVPGYEILEELGRGGMGVVYKARHVALNRVVALKMILAGGHAGPNELARFRGEAEAVARLKHPHIVQVYDVGEVNGLPYFSLEYVEGGSLDRKLAGTPLPPIEAAALVEKLARAMAAAHAEGLVHRDLKPANVLLAACDSAHAGSAKPRAAEWVPKITDFGLAKKLDAAGQTASGAVMGTPSYMAPEQAGGKSHEIGPACDVYALGATLYECLTGRPPFKAATTLDTLLQVVMEEPVPPRQLNARTPVDLETICLKCLRKEVPRRYSSAQELAEDLRRYQAGEPITARPVGWLERGWRWCRRNTTVAALLAGVVGSLLLGITVTTALAVREKRLANEMTRLAGREKAQRVQADLQAAQLLQQHGHALCEQGETGQGLLWLVHSLELVGETRAADVEGELLQQANDLEHLIRMDLALCARDLHALGGVLSHEGSVLAVAFSPDGALAVVGGVGFGVRVWDVVKGEPLGAPLPHPGEVRAVAVSADGKTILTAGHDLRPHGLDSVPTGQGVARLWDLQTRKPLGPPLTCPFPILCAALHPNGKTVLVGRQDGKAQLWDGIANQILGEVAQDGSPPVRAVAFSRDGTYFATGCAGNGGGRRWKTATRQPAGPVLRGGDIGSLAFRPDGKTILTGGSDQQVRLWNAVSGQPMGPSLRHTGQIRAVSLSPDARLALVTDDDQTARVWDLETGLPRGGPLRHAGRVYAAAFSGDGASFLTGEEDGAARLWQVAPGLKLGKTLTAHAEVFAARYSPDSKTILAGDLRGFVYLWDAATGKLRQPASRHDKPIFAVAFSPDGGRFATGESVDDGVVRQWTSSTGEIAGPVLPSGPVKDLDWSSDGKTILAANWSYYGAWPGVRLGAQRWDAAAGKPIEPFLKHGGDVWAVRFSPDGRTILTGSGDRTARLWDATTGKPLGEPLVHPFEVWSAVFSPDGKLVLTGGRDRQARVWEVASRRLVGKTMPHPAEIRSVTFSPDGKLILTGCRDHFSRLWDVQTRKPLGPPLPQFDIVEKVYFAPDGRTFLTAGRDRSVRQWTIPSLVTGEARQVREWVESITGLVLDENETVQVLNARQWSSRLARVANGRREAVPVEN